MRSLAVIILASGVGLGCVEDPLSPNPDGGAGPRDAAAYDARTSDAGRPDAEPPDATPSDVGVADSGADAGADAGAPDADLPDSGPAPCDIAGVGGECRDVFDCPDRGGFRSSCAGAPRNVCCIDPAEPCSVDGAPGLCLDVAACAFTSTPGRCPGAANIQCCADPAAACDPAARPTPNAGLVEVSHDPACPDGMVRGDGFCIDKFEASLVEVDAAGAQLGAWSPFHPPDGARVAARSIALAVPQGYISGVEAEAACTRAGKRLCTDEEWLSACRGPDAYRYPYGPTREDGRCNDARDRHPAIEFFGTSAEWIWSELGHACINQIPAALALTGQHPGCESAIGAVDMMGNLHEWTADPTGTFRGGFYADTRINGEGCLYRTGAHGRSHFDYSTGFRCCAGLR